MHRTIVYPNGMVEVEHDGEEAQDLGCFGVEDTDEEAISQFEQVVAGSDPVSDALSVLEAIELVPYERAVLADIRERHTQRLWAEAAGHEKD